MQFDTTEFIKVKISSDLDSIVLTDLQEKFILTELNGSILQRKLTKFEGKVVHFIQEASNGNDFNLVYSKDYDSKLCLGSTDKSNSKIKFPRNVEPGIVKIFDIFSNVE